MTPGRTRSVPRAGFFVHVMPALLYVTAVFYWGSAPSTGAPPLFEHEDKVLHALGFGGMVLVMTRALRYLWQSLPGQSGASRPGPLFKRQLIAAAGISLALGGLLELYQAALPHRTADWLDWLFDAIGIALAAAGLFALWSARAGSRPAAREAGAD